MTEIESSDTKIATHIYFRFKHLADTTFEDSSFETVPASLFTEMEFLTSLAEEDASCDGSSNWFNERMKDFSVKLIRYQKKMKGKRSFIRASIFVLILL